MTRMTMSDPRLHPSYNYADTDSNDPRSMPWPVSGISDDERQAELNRGLARRPDPELIERRVTATANWRADKFGPDERMTTDQLVTMFCELKSVSVKRATEWAETIVRRGVKR